MCIINQHAKALTMIKELEAKVAQLKATDTLMPCGTIATGLMYAIIHAKAAEIEDKDYQIYLPDYNNKVYNKTEVIAAHELEKVASIKYITEKHDCDDFAAELFSKFAGLIWTNAHAFNWFIDETDTLWYIEPQTKKLSQTIEGWQGNDIRFFVGR